MKSHYRGHKMALWLNLIPQLHQPGAADVSMRHHHFRERDPNFYTGPVRPESFTLVYGRNDAAIARAAPTECQPTTDNLAVDDDEDEDDDTLEEEPILSPEKETDLLQKLANKHYYRYDLKSYIHNMSYSVLK